MADIHIACPCCRNKRLFDADPDNTVGIIKIKCNVCGARIAVRFRMKKVHAERMRKE